MDFISRTEAKSKNLKTYFTGIACQFGHISKRYSSNGHCIECGVIYQKKYCQENSVDVKAKKKIYYETKYKNSEEWKTHKSIQQRIDRERNPVKFLLKHARSRAKEKGLAFTLTQEYVQTLLPSDMKCPVLGIELKIAKGAARPNSMTLDRIEPVKGYIEGNVAIISMLANTIKQNVTNPEMFRKLADWLEKQNYIKTLP